MMYIYYQREENTWKERDINLTSGKQQMLGLEKILEPNRIESNRAIFHKLNTQRVSELRIDEFCSVLDSRPRTEEQNKNQI